MTPLLGLVIKRLQLETAIGLMLLGIIIGSVVRSGGTLTTAMLGTGLIGIALTMGNIAGLMVLGRDYQAHASSMTGVYVCGMSIGSFLTAALTAPLAQHLGWQLSLASLSGGMALIAALLWLWLRYQKSSAEQQGSAQPCTTAKPNVQPPQTRALVKQPMIWLLSLAFAAHTFMFYGITAWLPLYLQQASGLTVAKAGFASSLFQVLGILGCLGVPALASIRQIPRVWLFLLVTLSWLAATLGLLLYPMAWPCWVIFGGIGSGGGFTVIFSLVMRYAKNLDENRVLSTVIQTAGYAVASISPFVIGFIYHQSEQWLVCWLLLTGAAIIMTGCGIAASNQMRKEARH